VTLVSVIAYHGHSHTPVPEVEQKLENPRLNTFESLCVCLTFPPFPAKQSMEIHKSNSYFVLGITGSGKSIDRGWTKQWL
jgi:hypothetical protein